ncbi:uncharacterized protein LOC131888237 [Tigriopus californicus]|nr:uncharacterized protein LOC131888237 [Tigriopus californicus]
MVLIGSAILPHASMILDPTLEDVPTGVDELHSAAKYIGDYVRDHEPDIIVLATPHGLNLSDSIGIYANHIAAGTAEWNGHWGEYKVSVNIHDDFALEMFTHLQKKRVNSNLILPFGERPAPLGWSEVVPLFFISEQRGTTGTRKRVCPYDVVIMTSPIQEKKHWDGDLADLTGQCVKVGHELFELFERTDYRIFFLASANLSPCHKTLEENPLFLPEPGAAEVPVSRKALIFDETIEQWIRSGSRTILLERALGLAMETFPCSMTIFGILQGLLDRSSFGGDILARRVPTYFGVIVALFHANEKGWKVLPRPFNKGLSGLPL